MSEAVRGAAVGVGLFLGVLVALWALWEGFRVVGEAVGLRVGQFEPNDRTMPHIHDIVGELFEPSRRNGPLLIDVLWDAALFTAKEAAAGFLLGALFGFALGALLAHSGLLQRGFLPYIVASQTIPILAVAPMVVVWVNPRLPDGLKDWGAVAVISAYLTFFPVTINTMRGLNSVDPRALELMRSYAAGKWRVLWKLRFPAALPFIFAALKIAAPASVVGAIIGELPASIQNGLGGAILNFNQYYVTAPTRLWATNLIAALLGIAFFLSSSWPSGSWFGARPSTSHERTGRLPAYRREVVRRRGGRPSVHRARRSPRRVRLVDRAFGLREVHLAPDRRRPRAADLGRGRGERQERPAGAARPRLRDRLPGRRALRLAHDLEEHRAAARADGRATARRVPAESGS